MSYTFFVASNESIRVAYEYNLKATDWKWMPETGKRQKKRIKLSYRKRNATDEKDVYDALKSCHQSSISWLFIHFLRMRNYSHKHRWGKFCCHHHQQQQRLLLLFLLKLSLFKLQIIVIFCDPRIVQVYYIKREKVAETEKALHRRCQFIFALIAFSSHLRLIMRA